MIMLLAALIGSPDALPAVDVSSYCRSDAQCVGREARAQNRLEVSWSHQSQRTREACRDQVEAGDIEVYSQLEACLIATRLADPAPTSPPPDDRAETVALRSALSERLTDAD
jgi:hypothetical protein